VFTARYALSPYIKQIRFVFKGLIKSTRNRRAVSKIRQKFREGHLIFLLCSFWPYALDLSDVTSECTGVAMFVFVASTVCVFLCYVGLFCSISITNFWRPALMARVARFVVPKRRLRLTNVRCVASPSNRPPDKIFVDPSHEFACLPCCYYRLWESIRTVWVTCYSGVTFLGYQV
jgi:hypothetical protein